MWRRKGSMILDSGNKQLAAFFSGSLAAGLIFIGGPLVFLNPPQCPIDYTQEQVDASDCIIGANLGLPFYLSLGLFAWIIVTAALGAWLYTYGERK